MVDDTYFSTKAGGLENLFGSKTRVRLLRLFLENSKGAFFVRELSRKVDAQINAVRRELMNLESLGIVQIFVPEDSSGNDDSQKKFYRLNPNFVLLNELKQLFFKARLMIEQGLVEKIPELGDIHYFALTGFFIGNKNAQTDMLLVGTINKQKLALILKKIEKAASKEINYTLFSLAEYKERKAVMDRFLLNILESEKIVITDKIDNPT